jgi:hypothetical protein
MKWYQAWLERRRLTARVAVIGALMRLESTWDYQHATLSAVARASGLSHNRAHIALQQGGPVGRTGHIYWLRWNAALEIMDETRIPPVGALDD